MKECKHPSEKVTYDICEGEWKNHKISWCRVCGAYQVSVVGKNFYTAPWTTPNSQVEIS